MRRLLPLLLLAPVLAGCGNDSQAPNEDATLLLDFQPNAVHAGIYYATTHGYDDANGIHLNVQVPGDATDPVKLLLARRIDFAVMDIHDLAIAREKGRDLVAVDALVQGPLAAVIAKPSITSPKQLEGQRVGVTGLPSDDAVLASEVAGAGGDPAKVKRTTIGFSAVRSLLTGKVAAATAFWDVEGLAVAKAKPGFHQFRVEQFGAPAYPELLLVTTREEIDEDRSTVQATVDSIRRGYREALLDEDAAVESMTTAVDGLDRTALTAQYDAVNGLWGGDTDASIGAFNMPVLERWAQWEAKFGIVKTPPNVALMFDPEFLHGTIGG